MHRTLAALCLIVIAGCAAPAGGGSMTASTEAGLPNSPATESPVSEAPTGGDTPAARESTTTPSPTATRTAGSTPTSTVTPRPDPERDVVGWENGYWYDESIDVDGSDGLDDAEFDRVKARAMARVELIRGLEFNRSVNVEFRDRSTFTFRPGRKENPWREGYWEALFVVGEDESTWTAYAELYDVIVDGLAFDDTIVLVVENTTSPRINRNTLAHELLHNLESQNGVYPSTSKPTQDEFKARRALVEGSAIFYEKRYDERCRTEWSCLDLPSRDGLDDGRGINMGLYVDFAMAYTAGGQFVERLHERGGNSALEGTRRNPPASTEQVIHPSRYPNETVTAVAVPDRSSGDWRRFTPPGRSRTWGTVGEARLYTMLWYNGVIPGREVEVTRAQQVDLNYSHPATDGWAGDRFVPYTNGSAYGYVLKTAWDTEADAREFHRAYVDLLRSRNATEVRDGVFRIPEGEPYADAFRVIRRDETVVIVNAPTVDGLADVHRPAD